MEGAGARLYLTVKTIDYDACEQEETGSDAKHLGHEHQLVVSRNRRYELGDPVH